MYNNIDPLIFLIRKDLFDNLRMAFFALSREEQDFVKNAILLDRFDGHLKIYLLVIIERNYYDQFN